MSQRTERTSRQLLLFLLVGGASAATDAGGFLLLHHLGVVPWLASALSFCAAFGVNYGGNRDLVFRGRRTDGALRRYVVLVVANLVASSALVALLVAVGSAPIVAKAISMAVVAAANFVALRTWVFPPRGPAEQGEPALPFAEGPTAG